MKNQQLAGCFLALVVGYATIGAYAAESAREIAPGVLFEKNVAIPMRDGAQLMANIYRPKAEGQYPVIMGLSAYGKDLHTKEIHAEAWEDMLARVPGLLDNSSGLYHTWELYDPEVWVPDGYILVRVDSRGSGKSPGLLSPLSGKEAEDYYDAIEWAGVQPWSNGKVGMAGISYYGIIQWKVASLQPPHLAGFIPWEGASDAYRDISRHGGILSNTFPMLWWGRQILPVQNGNGASTLKDADDGSPIGGPIALDNSELEANRIHPLDLGAHHILDDEFYAGRTPDFSKITAPFLSGANWGGMGLHLRGNVQGFMQSASDQKWLEVHGSNHYIPFFSPEGQALQKQFFDHFLKGEENGWKDRAPILLSVRYPGETFERREEFEWPLARTEWSTFPLDAANMSLGSTNPDQPSSVSYEALKDAAVFQTVAFKEQTEITGPIAANLWVSSSTTDMDLFVTLQLFDPQGNEVTFEGASEDAVPIAQGWLRASQRKIDGARSTPYQPYHTHDEVRPLTPDEAVEVQVEVWPTSIVVPEGYTLALRIEGKDFSRAPGGAGLMTGSGPFLHNDPKDRPADIFGGTNTIHTGGDYDSHLVLPIIPSKDS